jgi:hypothetical protein
MRAGETTGFGPTGLLFLFAMGLRPTRRSVHAAIERVDRTMVSHDPIDRALAEGSHPAVLDDRDEGPHEWLELLRDGLTFDFLGLADGPGLAIPDDIDRIGYTDEISSDSVEAVGLFPGPHLAEGATTLPVVRTQLALAIELAANLPGLKAICWTPSGTVLAPNLFGNLCGDWLIGGPFPSLALVRFKSPAKGGVHTEGLRFFTGQELHLGSGLAADRVAGTRLAVRLIHELVVIGTLTGAITLDLGEQGSFALSLVEDGQTIAVAKA